MALEYQLTKIPKDAAVVAICMGGLNRSPKLEDVLREKGYQNVTHAAATGLAVPMPPTQRKIDGADVVVALDHDVAEILRERYAIGDKILIELNVADVSPSEETYKTIREQIAPYLTD